jgi:lipopolysaccharide transport system ATP-binding protein
MSDIAIQVEGLGKRYKLGVESQRYKALRDVLTERIVHPFTRRKSVRKAPSGKTFWALDGISFEVQRGEVIGVIGRNGAGKSTLLKILSRITDPTVGRATIHGRVGALLEVGTGFHPELTGRENIFLNGAILGMRKTEIAAKFDAIAAFAEIDQFLDTPVKHYSSGMYMRLAFSVAAHLEPEILVVDEVLAVGDAAFQKKCLGKMGEVAQQGRTVLFVSHNLTAVATMCTRVLRLEQGRLTDSGGASEVISKYLQPADGSSTFDARQFPDDPDFRLDRAFVSQGRNRTGPFVTSAPVDITLEYTVSRPAAGLRVGIDVTTVDGITLWRSFDDDMMDRQKPPVAPGRYTAVCRLPENMFFPRQYLVSLSVGIQATRWISFGTVQQTLDFYNLNGVGHVYADERVRAGLLMVGLEWEIRPLIRETVGEETGRTV